jgi:radical SAM superfamily enzyme with C-terminal helix-hairpin-helix motif
MSEVNFSTQDTGACSFCRHHQECHIQDSIEELLIDEVKDVYDDEVEIVIYRCPEFEAEGEEIED